MKHCLQAFIVAIVTSEEGIVDEFITGLPTVFKNTLLLGKLYHKFLFVSHKLFDLLKDIIVPIRYSPLLGMIHGSVDLRLNMKNCRGE
jgi:hypothetical protein